MNCSSRTSIWVETEFCGRACQHACACRLPARRTLAEIGKQLGSKALAKVACVANSGTIIAWYQRLIARKLDGPQSCSCPGRPRISAEVEELVIRFARENSGLRIRTSVQRPLRAYVDLSRLAIRSSE